MYKFQNSCFVVLFCLISTHVFAQSSRQEFVEFCQNKHRPIANEFDAVEFFELRTEGSGTSWRHFTRANDCFVEMIWPNSGAGGKSSNGRSAILTNIAILNRDYFAYLGSIESTRTESTPRNPLGVSWQIQMFNESPTKIDCIPEYCFMLPRAGIAYEELARDSESIVDSWIVDREAKTGTVKLRSQKIAKMNGEAEVTAVFDLESGACYEMTISGKAPEGFPEKTASITHKIEYSQLLPLPIIKQVSVVPNFGTPTKSEISSVEFQPDVNSQVFRLPFYGISERNLIKKYWFADWWVMIAVVTTILTVSFYIYRKNL